MDLFSEGGAAGQTGQGGLGANPRHTRIKGGAASVGQRALGAQDLDEGGLTGLVAEAAETIGLLGGGLGLFLCDDAADGGVGLGAGRAPVGFGPQARVLEPGGGGVGAGGSGGDIVAVLVEQGNGADMLAITVVASSPFRRRTPNEAVTSGPARRRPTLAWRLAAGGLAFGAGDLQGGHVGRRHAFGRGGGGGAVRRLAPRLVQAATAWAPPTRQISETPTICAAASTAGDRWPGGVVMAMRETPAILAGTAFISRLDG